MPAAFLFSKLDLPVKHLNKSYFFYSIYTRASIVKNPCSVSQYGITDGCWVHSLHSPPKPI